MIFQLTLLVLLVTDKYCYGWNIHNQPTNTTNQNPQNTQVKRTIDNIVKKWMDVVVWVSWPYLGLYLGTITSSGLFFRQLLDAVKLQSINFGSLLSLNPGARERCHLRRIPFSQRKLQRSSIFKSTLDDIQHFEIMFQLENQM